MITSSLFSKFAAACSDPTFFSIPTWYKYLERNTENTDSGPVCRVDFSLVEGGVFQGQNLLLLSLGILDILIRIAALAAVAFVIYGGFKYMTSQGSPDGIKGAQNTILHALIGLVVALLAAAIVSFIGSSIG